MSLWEFTAAIEGWVKANTTPGDAQAQPPSEDDLEQALMMFG
jgi:hypothetical protein